MSCNIAQMTSVIDDVLHCLDEDGSLFHGDYACHTPFMIQIQTWELSSPKFGKDNSTEIGKVGDFLYKIIAQVDFAKLSTFYTAPSLTWDPVAVTDGLTTAQETYLDSLTVGAVRNAAVQPYYQDGAALALFQNTTLRINNSPIDCLRPSLMNMEWEQSSSSYRNLGESVNKGRTVLQMQTATSAGLRCQVSLPFFHTYSPFTAYPLAAHGNIKYVIQAKLAKLEDLLQYPYGKSITGLAVSAANMASNTSIKYHSMQITVSDFERDSVWEGSNDLLVVMQQMAFDAETVAAGTGAHKKKFILTGSGPVRAIHFWFAPGTLTDEDATYFTTLSGFGYNAGESFDNADLAINTQKVHDTLSAEFLRDSSAEIFGTRRPDGRYYSFYQCLVPRDYFQPSGSQAMFRNETVTLTIHWDATRAACEFNCAIEYYNRLRIKKGAIGCMLPVPC